VSIFLYRDNGTLSTKIPHRLFPSSQVSENAHPSYSSFRNALPSYSSFRKFPSVILKFPKTPLRHTQVSENAPPSYSSFRKRPSAILKFPEIPLRHTQFADKTILPCPSRRRTPLRHTQVIRKRPSVILNLPTIPSCHTQVAGKRPLAIPKLPKIQLPICSRAVIGSKISRHYEIWSREPHYANSFWQLQYYCKRRHRVTKRKRGVWNF
jgi:hypothetical protein